MDSRFHLVLKHDSEAEVMVTATQSGLIQELDMKRRSTVCAILKMCWAANRRSRRGRTGLRRSVETWCAFEAG
jgi:hypothetical protein